MRLARILIEDRPLQSNPKSDRTKSILMVFLPRFVVCVVLIMIASGIVKGMIATKSTSEKKPPQSNAILISTIESVHRPSNRLWSGYGTTRTMSSADIVAEVAGRVIDRPNEIEVGHHVSSNDLIVRLDDSDYINAFDAARQAVKSLEAQIDGMMVEEEQMQLQVQFASQEIEAAKRDLDRTDEAIAAGAGSAGERDVKLASYLRSQRELSVLQQQLDLIPSRRTRLEADLSLQSANMRIANEQVERSSVRAPFPGELQRIDFREGDWVGVGTRVARVVDLSRLEIPLKVPASASTWIKKGDEVRLWVKAPGGQPDQVGKIMRIAPEADSSNRSITIYVEVTQDANDINRLLPGQFVHGRVVTSDPHDRVILPRRAVQANHVYAATMNGEGTRVIEVVPVKVAYSFEAQMPELDPMESQWVALEVGYEPVENSLIAVSLLDQIIEGMRVRVDGDPVNKVTSDDIEGTNP